MYLYGPTLVLPELYALITSDSCAVQVADSQWKLTDSSTFTNFRRADAPVVRLNGAAAPESTLATVSVTDSLSAGLTDTFTGSQSIAVTDSCAVQASDASSISSSVSATDTNAVQVSDLSTVQNAFSVTDTCAEGLTDTASLSAVVPVTDTCAVQGSEVVAISSSVVAVETCVAGLTDTFTGSQTFSSTESVTVQLSDVSSILSTQTIIDSCAVQLAVAAVVSQVSIAAVDSLSAQLTESVNIVQNTLIDVTESCAVQASDVATVAQSYFSSSTDSVVTQLTEASLINGSLSLSETLAPAYSELITMYQALTVSDALTIQAFEDQFSSLPTAASDETVTPLSDAASVGVVFTSIDDLIAQLEEVGGKIDVEDAIPKSAQDDIGVLVDEGAVTELAGPYWSMMDQQEYGLVYADSYTVGLRENPGSMRW